MKTTEASIIREYDCPATQEAREYLDAQEHYDAHKNDGTAMDRAKLAEKLGANPAPQTRCRVF